MFEFLVIFLLGFAGGVSAVLSPPFVTLDDGGVC
jgi:hypothetical protein